MPKEYKVNLNFLPTEDFSLLSIAPILKILIVKTVANKSNPSIFV